MFSASKSQQANLLSLSELDALIARNRLTQKQLEQNSATDELRVQAVQLSEALLEASANLENFQDELAKVLIDIDLVDRRINQDDQKAKSVASERELKAIESELVSLKTRKSALEDHELELLEQIENAEKQVQLIASQRSDLNSKLELSLTKVNSELKTLTAHISELSSKRQQVGGSLDSELFLAYENKSKRGPAVGQTLGRDCSACRLAINGVEFDAMMALPEDSLPTCPNCDAFIIR